MRARGDITGKSSPSCWRPRALASELNHSSLSGVQIVLDVPASHLDRALDLFAAEAVIEPSPPIAM